MRPGRSLCPRCGSPEREAISTNRVRCPECGLGATTSRLTVDGSGGSDQAPEHDDLNRRCDMYREQLQVGLSQLSFPPYGLDAGGTGSRWLGSYGLAEGQVSNVELGHGARPGVHEGPQLRVDTRVPHLDNSRDH